MRRLRSGLTPRPLLRAWACGCQSGGSRAGRDFLGGGPRVPWNAACTRGPPRASTDARGPRQPRSGAPTRARGDAAGGAGRRDGLDCSGRAASATGWGARQAHKLPGRRGRSDWGSAAGGGRASVGAARQCPSPPETLRLRAYACASPFAASASASSASRWASTSVWKCVMASSRAIMRCFQGSMYIFRGCGGHRER